MAINPQASTKRSRAQEEEDRQELFEIIDITIINLALIAIALIALILLALLFNKTATVWLLLLEDCRQ